MINGNMIGASMLTPKSFVLEDENGNSFVGVTVGEEAVLDATPADVRINKTFASDEGVQVGENTITYRTTQSFCLILPGDKFSIPLPMYNCYNYTKFQAILVLYSPDYSSSAKTMSITINDSVFSTETSEKLANITKNSDTRSIDLNITNNSDDIYMIRYFTYCQEE